MNDKRDKLKLFLQKKIDELEVEIKSRKRKNLILKIIHGSLIFISITSASVGCIVSAFGLPAVIIPVISAVNIISTLLTYKFDMKYRKNRLSKAIKTLSSIRNKFDYVVHCNGDLTDEECAAILKEFSDA